ncbi:MAG: hypothetical protein AB7U73_10410 [Pirellulales bacterium]
MSQPNQILHGVIRGRTIELAEDAGLPDGQQVEIVVRAPEPREVDTSWVARTAGALADDPEAFADLEEVLAERKLERRNAALE